MQSYSKFWLKLDFLKNVYNHTEILIFRHLEWLIFKKQLKNYGLVLLYCAMQGKQNIV